MSYITSVTFQLYSECAYLPYHYHMKSHRQLGGILFHTSDLPCNTTASGTLHAVTKCVCMKNQLPLAETNFKRRSLELCQGLLSKKFYDKLNDVSVTHGASTNILLSPASATTNKLISTVILCTSKKYFVWNDKKLLFLTYYYCFIIFSTFISHKCRHKFK